MAVPESEMMDTLPLHLFQNSPNNKVCFDCPSEKVVSIVMDYGVFVCKRCGALHAKMGRKTKSVMALFTPDEIHFLEGRGNTVGLAFILARWPEGQDPIPHSDTKEVATFMHAKYTQKQYWNDAALAPAEEAQRAEYAAFKAAKLEEDVRRADQLAQQARRRKISAEGTSSGGAYGVVKKNAVSRTRDFGRVSRARATSMSQVAETVIGAAEAGKVDQVRQLIDRGADINQPTKSGTTALHRAAAKGHIAVVELLLDRGAFMEAADRWGDRPLHKAAHNLHRDVIELLLTKGALYLVTNADGLRPDQMATDPEVKALFQAAADKAGVPLASESVPPLAMAQSRLGPAARRGRARAATISGTQLPPRSSSLRSSSLHAADANAANPYSGFEAVVLFDFAPQYEAELGVSAGDVIVVEDEHPSTGKGWWLARKGHVTGLVPAAYCEIKNKKGPHFVRSLITPDTQVAGRPPAPMPTDASAPDLPQRPANSVPLVSLTSPAGQTTAAPTTTAPPRAIGRLRSNSGGKRDRPQSMSMADFNWDALDAATGPAPAAALNAAFGAPAANDPFAAAFGAPAQPDAQHPQPAVTPSLPPSLI
ncbi:MHC_I family protein [Thecamonas trahens ATCC 50062]|uniref:MHC_I family protein n=1 Tax=Thecamonas trahens ATCC 50062 TaxID=461836 RepID=A0A0L0DUX7_THETB|nr:MHC_I family protein [Thecamonas trahens ATCC 50062]KNC56002.1 MHC_I family protein [Thecamonas trahens ATCC 50062]|eukprot:XP_013761048.1 MHC_I family protein [Thecamonas trahens ATCC 50062]